MSLLKCKQCKNIGWYSIHIALQQAKTKTQYTDIQEAPSNPSNKQGQSVIQWPKKKKNQNQNLKACKTSQS